MRSKISTLLELVGLALVGHVCFQAATWFGELVVAVALIGAGYVLGAPARPAAHEPGEIE